MFFNITGVFFGELFFIFAITESLSLQVQGQLSGILSKRTLLLTSNYTAIIYGKLTLRVICLNELLYVS